MKKKLVLRNVALLSSSLVMLTLMHPLHAETYAEAYEKAYMSAKAAGKSEAYAKAYAAAKIDNQSDEYAAAVANQADIKARIAKLNELIAEKCTNDKDSDTPTFDPALIALSAAGAVITIGGIAVVANSGSDAPASTTINTFNGVEQYYVYEPATLQTSPSNEEERKNLIGLDNLSHLRDVFHSSDNKEHMGEHTNEAHSLEERGHKFKQAEIVTKDGKKTYNMTFIDAIGPAVAEGGTPQSTYLGTSTKVSGLYLQNTNLDVKSGATLTADAVSVKKGTLDVNGSLSVGAFLLDADATLKNGDKITFNDTSTQEIIKHMKDQLPDRYRWADFGKFDLRGTVDKFTVSKGMTVYVSPPADTNAPKPSFTHAGGTLVVSASKPITVKDYTVSETSILSVKWDQADQQTPLMTVTETCNIGANKLGVMLDSIPAFILKKDAKLTILSATSLSGTRDTYKQDSAGGRFEFKTEAVGGTTTNAITVTCLVTTNEVAAAAGASQKLSAGILGKTEGTVKGRFAAMEIPAAVSALDAAVSDAYLAPVAASAPSYFSIHQHSHTAGGWNHVDEASDATLTSMGFNAGQDVKLGFSVSTPVVQTPAASPTVGAHLLNNGVFMDAFYNGAAQAVGSTVGYQLGMFSAGMTYMFDERSGVDATNPMGRLEVNNVHQHRILFNVGLNKRIEKMDFSATVFAEALRYAQGYDLLIDGEPFHLKGHSFDRNCGASLQAKANFDAGFVSAAIGLAGSTHKVEPTTSVSFNFTY